MSIPSIIVGEGNWAGKSGNLLGYAVSDVKIVPREFTVSRALNTATRVNVSGNIEGVNANIPRIDYFGGQASLLVEPSAQNLAFHSENWGSNWLLDGATRTTGSTSAFLAPDGTFTANALSPTSGNVAHYIYSNTTTKIAFVSGTIYTQSVFFKAGGTNLPVSGSAGRYAQLTFNGGSFSQLGYANFDLQLGTVAVVSGTSADANRTARIENYGNGWYRCILTATCTATSNNEGVYSLLVNASGNTRAQSFAGVTGDILYGWGAQLETGSVATSYIPTTTGSVTRNADVISVTGVAGLIGQTEGTIYAEVDLTTKLGGLNGDFIVEVLFDTNTKLLIRRHDSSDRFEVTFKVGGTNVFSRELILLAAGVHKFGLAYKSGNNNAFVDGSSVLTGTASGGLTNTFTITDAMNRVNLGHSSLVANTQFKDRIRAVAIYTTRLPNTTTDGSPSLQSITTL